MNTIRLVVIGFCVSTLSACTTMNGNGGYPGYYAGSYNTHTPNYNYEQMQYYQYQQNYQSYNVGNDYGYGESPRGQVTVPDSYHVGAYHSPTAAKDRDKKWVSSQNPQSYTIEVADDEKPSRVAKKLYQIPKNEPMAEVKYQRDGKAYYKGLYGTYSSPEEAQKALNSLPDDVKQGAGIKSWGHVQSNVSE
jgi:hypothetical protein